MHSFSETNATGKRMMTAIFVCKLFSNVSITLVLKIVKWLTRDWKHIMSAPYCTAWCDVIWCDAKLHSLLCISSQYPLFHHSIVSSIPNHPASHDVISGLSRFSTFSLLFHSYYTTYTIICFVSHDDHSHSNAAYTVFLRTFKLHDINYESLSPL